MKHPHFWFVGPSGSGKTTLAKSIADLPCVTLASDISQAFLRQLLTESARCAVVLDEIEDDTLSNLAELIEQDPRGFAALPSRLFAFSQSLPPLPPDILDEANVHVLLIDRMTSPPMPDEFLGVLDIEDDQEADERKLNGVLELAQQAATGGIVPRGGSDGTASAISGAFAFGSILIPPMEPDQDEADLNDQADEHECLRHLLANYARAISGTAWIYRGSGEKEPQKYLAVANDHPALREVFHGTQWAGGNWSFALQRLPGAMPVHAGTCGNNRRCIAIPEPLIPSTDELLGTTHPAGPDNAS